MGCVAKELNQYLGKKLKQIRQDNGWSLDRAASETGVSKAMLGQIERGESSPTISTLWKIADGFQLSLSTLIEPLPVEKKGTVFRRVDRLRHRPASDDMLVASVFPYDNRYGFEMFELTLLPNYERLSEPHEVGVVEHVIVISGTMEVLVNDEWLALKKGGAVRFAADKPHGYRNLSSNSATFHNLIYYSSKK